MHFISCFLNRTGPFYSITQVKSGEQIQCFIFDFKVILRSNTYNTEPMQNIKSMGIFLKKITLYLFLRYQ